jgi:hypothetical protein
MENSDNRSELGFENAALEKAGVEFLDENGGGPRRSSGGFWFNPIAPFPANAVRLRLHALAYNLGSFLRTLATPELIKDWSLKSLKEKLIKIGANVVSHGALCRVSDGGGRRFSPAAIVQLARRTSHAQSFFPRCAPRRPPV